MADDVISGRLAETPEPARAALAELCRIIASSNTRVRGEIKWNALSFAIDDHFATTLVTKSGGIRLVLHTGAKRPAAPRALVIDDPEELLTWRGADRAIAEFDSADDVRRHEASLRVILAAWIAQTQRATS